MNQLEGILVGCVFVGMGGQTSLYGIVLLFVIRCFLKRDLFKIWVQVAI